MKSQLTGSDPILEPHTRVLQLQRLGHKPHNASDLYSHVTPVMIEAMLHLLQQRWEQYGTWTWATNPRQDQDAA